MKHKFEEPILEIVLFDTENNIVTSGNGNALVPDMKNNKYGDKYDEGNWW